MASDQVIWSEQGRLHLSYTGTTHATVNGKINIAADVDGNSIDQQGEAGIGVRKGDTVIVSKSGSSGATVKCYVSAVTNTPGTETSITVKPYTVANLNDVTNISANTAVSVFVYGSEYQKGTDGRETSNSPSFKSLSNNPIILKDKFAISGSDASQIGWVEVSGEDGQSGYLWYLKAAGDTKARFTDYCEMSLIEAEKAASGSGAAGQNLKGSEGLFAALNDRGNIMHGDLELEQFNFMLKELDKQGAIEENMLFLDRTESLLVDDFLAGINAPYDGGTSYGVFDNDSDMALNLGFNGFRRGSYDFYKTDWKYLNDIATRGGVLDTTSYTSGDPVGKVRGVMVPAGTSSVYDQSLGKNIKRPFLHVRYRAAGLEDRKFKTWTTGSVGASTSDLDAMEMHFLTERCLVVQGANNFFMIEG